MHGKFVVLEGPDGAGKTTQFNLLVEELRKRGYSIIAAREPGGTRIGERIRDILKSKEYTEIDPITELLLFSASRRQLAKEVIRPALSNRLLVLLDRYWPSSVAYQGGGRGVSNTAIAAITNLVCEDLLEPDLFICIDISTREAARCRHARAAAGGEFGRWDEADIRTHQEVRKAYLQMVLDNPERWELFDGSLPVRVLHQQILERVLELLQQP